MYKEIIVAFFGSGLLFSAIFTFIQFLFKRHDEKTEKDKELKDGVMCLLQDKLIFLTEKAIEKNEISNRQLEMITEMYEKYKSLGGNGYVEDNFERCKELRRV